MVYEVYKKISKGRDPKTQKEYYWKIGTLVESGQWKNERTLIAQGYLGPPRKSQKEINKFLANNKNASIATTTKVVGAKRPAIEKEKKIDLVPLEL
jgi:hypothetical protein